MKKYVFTSLLVFASVSAMASEGNISMDVDTHRSSTMERQDKKFTMVASPVGVGPSMNFEQGAAAGIFINPKTILQLEFGDGNTSEGGWFLSNDQTKIHSDSATIAIKHFTGNSFYVKGGIDYRRINYAYTYSNFALFGGNLNDPQSSYEFNASSFTGSIVIGNQWQWEGFTLGCDWFGIAMPFASTIHSESIVDTSSGTNTDPRIVKDLHNNETKYLKTMAYQGLRLYLGASF
jgi:hypothetical protein